MVRPEELTKNEPLLWSAGNGSEVWDLFCACAAGDVETVERLVDGNPSLVRAHYEYRTPLYFAVRENRMAVATLLLDRGANPFYNGEDLIEMARLRGLADMEALIEGCRPASKRPLSVFQTMAQAVRSGNVAAARQVIDGLLARGSSADIWTAAYVGNAERVRALLDLNPSLVNQSSDDGSGTPLVHAADRGHLDVVRLLLERGADPNVPEEGNAPHGRALYAAVYNRHFDAARLLLEHGASPNQEVESSADTPSIAIMNSDSRMIELLASYGAVWRTPVQLASS
jgi:ankyrin repeat protein